MTSGDPGLGGTLRQDPLILRGGWVATMDPAVGDLPRGDVLIADGRIVRVAEHIDEPSAQIVDAANHLVLPGFVDTHRHTWEAILAGVGVDWLQGHYFEGVHRSARLVFEPDDVYDSTRFGVAQAIDVGVTTLLDWSHILETTEHAAAAVHALADGGIRARLAVGGSSREWRDLPSDSPLDRRLLHTAASLVAEHPHTLGLAVAGRGPEFSTDAVVRADWELAAELGVLVSVHLGAGLKAIRARGVDRLEALGLLRPGVCYIHANHLTDDDMRRIGDSGGTVSLAPEVESMMGMGPVPYWRLRSAGIPVSLSTDEVASGSGSMLVAMRTLLAAERSRAAEEAFSDDRSPAAVTLTAREALAHATVDGAVALGLADEIGAISAGLRADILVVDLTSSRLRPVNDPVGQFVVSGESSDIRHVLVGGRFVKRDGQVSGGVSAARAADAARDRVFARLGRMPGVAWLPRDLDGPEWFERAGT